MRIGEVAERAGVSVRALRYYEEQGLLAAYRSPGGQRHYAPEAVERVRFIQNLYAAGLGSKAVLQILPCMEHGILTQEMHERLLAERARVQAQLEELIATRDKLDLVIRSGQAHRSGATASRGSVPEAGHVT
ncbi:MerR family transcriptional regulator [Herbiconiux sp. SYSU D00978]|uniref:MerR family transcriptional regulator n=1 Tax=Herbiconiux sp. SYSU D00978 TaxID=2812562 RepID=UPI001A97B1A5|nr:MerR family transcriptional regulator [Herbiconiux sp. SYSU D00978]